MIIADLEYFAFPFESDEYRCSRIALLDAETDLRRRIERGAEQRRSLSPGGEVTDYLFERVGPDNMPTSARMSELFGPHDSLVLYSLMYGPDVVSARARRSAPRLAARPTDRRCARRAGFAL
ncbi:MAG: DUF899 family protein [Betaproteobacteria bacterium]|nr:DUF899 family protein [Betaproteobacteria bacterium]